MIDRLRQMAIFVRVVEEGSFRAAASKLGVSSSRTSEAVSNLEAYLGATLLVRTTRKISLTNEGRNFFRHTSLMLRSAEDGLREMSNLVSEPKGALKISIPAFFSSSNLVRLVGDFVRLHPDVELSVSFTDQDVDLMTGGFDVIIHAGGLNENSKLAWCKLGESQRVIVVGEDYLAERGQPGDPSELLSWDWISFRHPARTFSIMSADGKKTELDINKQARLTVDSVEALYYFATQNFGVAVVLEDFASRGLENGQLARLFPNHTLRPVDYYAVWPDKSIRDGLTKFFIQFLTDSLENCDH